jgi:hypothetical protein
VNIFKKCFGHLYYFQNAFLNDYFIKRRIFYTLTGERIGYTLRVFKSKTHSIKGEIMDYLKEILRLLHIVGGMYWFGSVMTMYFFITPTVAATGDAGQQFMKQLGSKSGFSNSILIAALGTGLAGVSLYWLDSNGFKSEWMNSSVGTGFGIGGFFGVIALVFGIVVNRTIAAIGKLGMQIQGKPTPEQLARMQILQKRSANALKFTTYSLIVSAFFMATARFLMF